MVENKTSRKMSLCLHKIETVYVRGEECQCFGDLNTK